MSPVRRLPTRQASVKKASKHFDPGVFLAAAGVGKTVFEYNPKKVIFSQGEKAGSVFYIQKGRVKLSIVSQQGKEATIA
jgi:CRP/FNR family cyclic AMP-dependent transcriptional regulator